MGRARARDHAGDPPRDAAALATRRIARRHMALGWCSLLGFLTLGIFLEALHGFKVGFYLDVDQATRRLMWTLAHAHGTLLGLVHLAFAFAVGRLADWGTRGRELASRSLTAGAILLPAGFFLGGVNAGDGDPGPAILLVPVGAIVLWVALALTAYRSTHSWISSER